ncbi:MAG: class I SAM-dependent methyltransferase [Cytophagales bacterium]|nr:class I SAM-dependent methyltransferase [Cytophagales bacterium]MDW8384214.1 class I SAM-dependent methyltransferase [Flammeovirgaceae bacterium]
MQTAERSSAALSDNFVFQRHQHAYQEAIPYVENAVVLEVGTGTGYGTKRLLPHAKQYVGIDKYNFPFPELKEFYHFTFYRMKIPPLRNIESNYFDTVVSFQVIEHIQEDEHFIREIFRVLKEGGKLVLTTPNIKMSLTRNPWHVREYTAEELYKLLQKYFSVVNLKGVYGNEKITAYYEQNKASVAKLKRWDFLNLEYRLPRKLLQIPYDILNRFNRRKLLKQNTELVSQISLQDYYLGDVSDSCYDFFCVATK